MKIEKKLNVVLPLQNGWVHATPISYAVFEKYFVTISKAFARVYGEGLGVGAGPRVAAMMLKKIAIEDGDWEGAEGVEKGLVNEIYRLANVVLPGEQGWTTTPFYEAVRQELLDPEEASEVVNLLVFFTLVSSMHKKIEIPRVLTGMNRFWGGLTTSLDSTEYAASLPISTPEEPSGERETASSIPS